MEPLKKKMKYANKNWSSDNKEKLEQEFLSENNKDHGKVPIVNMISDIIDGCFNLKQRQIMAMASYQRITYVIEIMKKELADLQEKDKNFEKEILKIRKFLNEAKSKELEISNIMDECCHLKKKEIVAITEGEPLKSLIKKKEKELADSQEEENSFKSKTIAKIRESLELDEKFIDLKNKATCIQMTLWNLEAELVDIHYRFERLNKMLKTLKHMLAKKLVEIISILNSQSERSDRNDLVIQRVQQTRVNKPENDDMKIQLADTSDIKNPILVATQEAKVLMDEILLHPTEICCHTTLQLLEAERLHCEQAKLTTKKLIELQREYEENHLFQTLNISEEVEIMENAGVKRSPEKEVPELPKKISTMKMEQKDVVIEVSPTIESNGEIIVTSNLEENATQQGQKRPASEELKKELKKRKSVVANQNPLI